MSTQSINVGRFNGILGRMLSMGGQEDPAGALSPEISAVLALETDRPEWQYLGNGRLMACNLTVVTSGALTGSMRLRNPTDSGSLAVIERISVNAITAPQRFQVRIGTAAAELLTPMVTQAPRDSRSSATVGALRASSDQVVGVGTKIYEATIALNVIVELLVCPLVLAPGSHIEVNAADLVVGQSNANFVYRERAIEPFEK